MNLRKPQRQWGYNISRDRRIYRAVQAGLLDPNAKSEKYVAVDSLLKFR